MLVASSRSHARLTTVERSIKCVMIVLVATTCRSHPDHQASKFASIVVDPTVSRIQLFWKSDDGRPLRSIQNVKDGLERHGQHLRFAMNGGMYESGNQPKGLFIQDHKLLHPLDTGDGSGNFYLKPNGVFYVTANDAAFIVPTQSFSNDDASLATQSGPMLVIDGAINPRFLPTSSSLNIRNGVGIRPDHKVVFAMSREPVSFYELAAFFQSLDCRDALYLDGAVSRMYLPEQGIAQLDGDFGVIIGIATP